MIKSIFIVTLEKYQCKTVHCWGDSSFTASTGAGTKVRCELDLGKTSGNNAFESVELINVFLNNSAVCNERQKPIVCYWLRAVDLGSSEGRLCCRAFHTITTRGLIF